MNTEYTFYQVVEMNGVDYQAGSVYRSLFDADTFEEAENWVNDYLNENEETMMYGLAVVKTAINSDRLFRCSEITKKY